MIILTPYNNIGHAKNAEVMSEKSCKSIFVNLMLWNICVVKEILFFQFLYSGWFIFNLTLIKIPKPQLWLNGPVALPYPPIRKHQLTKFKQPTLTVRVEERVREVVSVIFRYLEGLVFNAFIQVLWGWLIFRYLMQRHACTLKGDLSVTLYFATSVYWSVLETDPEQVFWQISPIIDAPVHAYESLHRWLVFHVRVVQACV